MLQGPMVGFHDSNGRLITTDFMPDQPLVLQVNKLVRRFEPFESYLNWGGWDFTWQPMGERLQLA